MKLFFAMICACAAAFTLLCCGTYDVPGTNGNEMSVPPAQSAADLLSTWKGFNLLNMFYRGGSDTDKPFSEKEFQMMAEWGFNFVRIPIDYRILTPLNIGNHISERAMRRIDQAIEYGIKYNIHVCLNLHRAPGYTVASPPERTDLWTQEKPQEAFARMWGYFSRRYQHIPNENLSFNLVNEPPEIDEKLYYVVVKKAAEAIWAHNPHRLIIADGLAWGMRPSAMIRELGIAQAARGYQPFTLTHYQAEWVDGSQDYFMPTWPAIMLPQYLYGIGKNEVQRSMYHIAHDFNEAYNLDVNVGVVSSAARLVVKADDAIIYDRLFTSAAGRGEWTTVVYQKEWNIYQNIFNKDYRVEIPAGTRQLTLEVTDGDWMTVRNMRFSPVSGDGSTFQLTPNTSDWDSLIPTVTVSADGAITVDGMESNKESLWETCFKPWQEYAESGGGVMVGEFGSYNKTPHDVVLRWMEDNLQLYNEHGFGWALWNLTGSLGVLDSGRSDVNYEDYQGYKLDRAMLDLLQKYAR